MNWIEAACPPYAGLYWACTVHGTVEMVHVSPKKPKHLGRADPLMAPADPFVYQFGDNPELNFETLARRRWTHWLPVTAPDPPFAGHAGVAAEPPGDDPSAHTASSVEQELERRVAGLREVGYDWRRNAERFQEEQRYVAAEQAKLQEEMDRADASAYDPATFAAAEAEASRPTTPRALLAAANRIAVCLLGETEGVRAATLRRLERSDPVVWVLVKHAMRTGPMRAKGSDEAA